MKTSEIKLRYVRKSTGIKVCSSADVEKAFRNFWDKDSIDYCETFAVMYLSRSHEVLGIMKVSEGGLDACLVDARKIFQGALLANASSIILAHNHPSGSLNPFSPDLKITYELSQAATFLKIKVLDHFIHTSDTYSIFADEGYLQN